MLAGGRELPQRSAGVVELLAPALLAALVATQRLRAPTSRSCSTSAAPAWLAAGVAIALRAPLLVVIVVAAVTAGAAESDRVTPARLGAVRGSSRWSGACRTCSSRSPSRRTCLLASWPGRASRWPRLVLLPVASRRVRCAGLPLRWLVAFAIFEICIPFPLIGFGEQRVSSSLAAILIAALPLVIAFLALRFDRRRAPDAAPGWPAC